MNYEVSSNGDTYESFLRRTALDLSLSIVMQLQKHLEGQPAFAAVNFETSSRKPQAVGSWI